MFLFQLPYVVFCWFLLNQRHFYSRQSNFCGIVNAQDDFGEDEYYDEDDEEMIVDENGDVINQSQTVDHPLSKSIRIRNDYTDKSIQLLWINNETGEEVDMGVIEPNGNLGFNSFIGHTFAAKTMDLTERVPPYTVSITETSSEYSFGDASVKANAKVSSNVGHKPFFKYLNVKSYSASAKFRSYVPYTIDVWYDDGRDGIYQGSLKIGQEYTVNSYEGHIFYFTKQGEKSNVLARHIVSMEKVLYVIEDPNSPAPQHMRDHQLKEEAFMAEYKNRTGLQWRHYFGPDGPRGPPSLHMWPADYLGQKHHIVSDEGAWNCLGAEEHCHSKASVNLTLEVISLKPKAFIIRNFLNLLEAQEIIATAKPLIKTSYVGNRDGGGARTSDTRTSRNAWIPRVTNGVTETLFRRAEHLLNISSLTRDNTEDLQVVNYVHGQKYDSHHDWGVSGYPHSRFVTLLLYLTDMASPTAGGETAFPKAADGRGIKVHAGKGSAVLFYNLLEDGNADDLSLHAALPVVEGEKWLANFWVWDPKRKD